VASGATLCEGGQSSSEAAAHGSAPGVGLGASSAVASGATLCEGGQPSSEAAAHGSALSVGLGASSAEASTLFARTSSAFPCIRGALEAQLGVHRLEEEEEEAYTDDHPIGEGPDGNRHPLNLWRWVPSPSDADLVAVGEEEAWSVAAAQVAGTGEAFSLRPKAAPADPTFGRYYPTSTPLQWSRVPSCPSSYRYERPTGGGLVSATSSASSAVASGATLCEAEKTSSAAAAHGSALRVRLGASSAVASGATLCEGGKTPSNRNYRSRKARRERQAVSGSATTHHLPDLHPGVTRTASLVVASGATYRDAGFPTVTAANSAKARSASGVSMGAPSATTADAGPRLGSAAATSAALGSASVSRNNRNYRRRKARWAGNTAGTPLRSHRRSDRGTHLAGENGVRLRVGHMRRCWYVPFLKI